jgi:dihydrofolate reductase
VISLVVARSRNGTIGADGTLPWRLPSDLRRFREITTGGTVVMGRRTFESIPDAFRPLPERRNIVLSRNGYTADDVEVLADLDSALDACAGDCFVIGGEQTYRDALPFAERAYVTEIDGDIDGDAFFPELEAGRWRRSERGEPQSENGHSFTFCVYDRVA